MHFKFKGKTHNLNKHQLDVINPAMNKMIQGHLTQAGFEAECLALLEAAGCPPGYDTGIRPDADLPERISRWRTHGHVGLSSLSIWHHMTESGKPRDGWRHPLDPDDLNRCLLLLELIPEWRPRMAEMAERSPHWAALVEIWPALTELFLAEVGLDWSHGKRAPETYSMMKEALEQA